MHGNTGHAVVAVGREPQSAQVLPVKAYANGCGPSAGHVTRLSSAVSSMTRHLCRQAVRLHALVGL